MFAPRDRLRDSHYHSMYRTLRSARINYSAQAARFKDEGDSYKLVMDVREFVGGDLTVRTAGGTLSVRGRLETGGEGGDADSTTSRASSARTLHRRFNLPPDADGEKVESMLSRDAVLTVTMPKRTDVRVIPVTMEGAGGGGRSGTKRHSATQPDPGPSPRKRPQDHHDPKDTDKRTTQTPRERSTSRRRHAFGMSENKDGERGRDNERQNRREREEETERSRERTSRRGSDIFMRGGCNRDEEEGHRRRSYLDSTPRGVNQETDYGDKDNVSSNRRRSRDIVEDETEDKHGQRNRRRTSKYEDVKEINIPIRLENSGDAETVEQYPAAGDINTTTTHTGSTSASLSKNKIDSPPVTQSRDRDNTQHRPTVRQKVENEASIASDKPHISSTISKDKSNIHKVSEKENIKPCEEGSPWTYSNLYVNNSQTKEKGRESQTNATKATRGKEADATKKYHFGNKSQGEPEVRVVAPPETPATALDANTHKQQLKQKDAKGDAKESVKYHDVCVQKDKADKRQDDSEGNNNYLRNSSQDSESPESGSKSPCGGREVKVEKKQSDMEGDMFKDCWQNFSSTLQEVLARLQELSSELGHSKPQSKTSSPSTASSRQSPPSPSPQQPSNIRVASSRNSPHEEVNKRPTSVSSEGSEWVAGERGTTVGVGGKPPTTPPPVYADERLATRSGLNGHGAKYAKDFTTHQDPCVTQTKKTTRYEADKPGMQQVSGSSVSENVSGVPRRGSGDGGGGRGGGARARDNTRPVSLVLPNSAQGDAIRQHIPMNLDLEGSSDDLSTKVSKLQTNDAPGPRPRPTSLNVTHEGTLLKDLRKSSPVDALKDRFLSHITPTSESSPGITDVHYIPVEVEATKTVPTTSRVPEDTASRGRHTATGVPLHQRRGKGVNSLVIVDDDKSSTSSSQVSTSTSEDNSNATSSADSEGGVDSKGGWKVPHLADKAAAGNSSALNLGPDPFQQHSSSRGGGADSRAQPHGIGSGSVTGGSKPKPSPLLSSTSPSDSDPDVDEIISQAERVIEETRRLSASAANDSLVVNDLGRDKHSAIKRDKVKSTGTTSKRSGFNLAPNIDTRSSPESNFVEIQEEDHTQHNKGKGEEAEGVVEGCLSIPLLGPAGRPGRPRHKPTRTAHTHVATPPTRNDSLLIEAVDDTDDVTECEEVRPTIVKSPEIQSSDVMGCARESGRGGGSEAPPSPQEAPPRTLAHQAQPTRAPRRPSSRERMGGLFSRGRLRLSTLHSILLTKCRRCLHQEQGFVNTTNTLHAHTSTQTT
ncbi:serine-rich adhesin for platelets-like [Homarus americanus]|uniref:serine-rich adhesin for platelets-like n=1 Tax=Homarus americanus TaxID=6706 RepID=UPI001C457E9B|nr:serine-rich adhesin for platelets-like [Homarus americanus]XP_042222042.1 serine-rich adhesin for platelets-like [Homarus americanus]